MNIRKGKIEDLPQVLALIKELARYENAPNEVVVTIADMELQGFGENPLFNFFVAENNQIIVGIALFYYKYSTWKGKCLFLEDIVITEKERGKGIGKLLFDAVAQVAKVQQVKRMEWQVLNWNEPAINFYKKYDSIFDNEWINCKLTDKELSNWKQLN